jgi:hypothetical protein
MKSKTNLGYGKSYGYDKGWIKCPKCKKGDLIVFE